MSAAETALAVLLGLACVPWLIAPLVLRKFIRALPRLIDMPPPVPDRQALVSIITPARNEEATVEAAVASRLADADARLELVLVNDRSEDRTGALLDALAATDPRVRVVHVRELPDGWLGKNHALHLGTRAARGEWLLYTDADVHFAPGTVGRAVAFAEARGLDFLTLVPDVWSEGFLLDCAMAAFGKVFAATQRPWAISDPRSRAAGGIGAFNMVRRSAFERTAGFPWLAYEIVDDIALGILMKRSGARCAMASGQGLVGLTWYASLREVVLGLEKNLYPGARCSLALVLLLALLVSASESVPWVLPALAAADVVPAPLGWLGAVALLLGTASSVAAARWGRRPVLPAVAAPIGAALLVFTLLRSGILGALRGGVSWRGTFYPRDRLRRGCRLGC